MNKVLSKLSSTPLSKKSSRKLRHTLGNLLNSGVSVNSFAEDDNFDLKNFNAEYKDIYIMDLSFAAFLIHSPIIKVLLNPTVVNHSIDPNNRLFSEWIIAHELSHAYTRRTSQYGRPLSEDTMKDIQDRQRACLYQDPSSFKKVGEDLADLIAFEIVEKKIKTFPPSQIEGFFKSFCYINQSKAHTVVGPNGHNTIKSRLYNSVKHSKKMQDYLGYVVPETVCKIKFEDR